jgi:hypothetical protein
MYKQEEEGKEELDKGPWRPLHSGGQEYATTAGIFEISNNKYCIYSWHTPEENMLMRQEKFKERKIAKNKMIIDSNLVKI